MGRLTHLLALIEFSPHSVDPYRGESGSFKAKGTVMQTGEAALVELNDEDLLVVSGGLGPLVTIVGPVAGAIGVGVGSNATANRATGIASANGNVLASSFASTGNVTIQFP